MAENRFQILYVDDEEHNLISFAATFRKEYKVYTATTGEEGLRMMRENDIKLVITDQRMPEMTGIQFLEKIIPARILDAFGTGYQRQAGDARSSSRVHRRP